MRKKDCDQMINIIYLLFYFIIINNTIHYFIGGIQGGDKHSGSNGGRSAEIITK